LHQVKRKENRNKPKIRTTKGKLTGMILHLRDLEDSSRQLLALISTFGKVTSHDISIQSQSFPYIPTLNMLREKSEKQAHSQQTQGKGRTPE
jgi:hypothetical protein